MADQVRRERFLPAGREEVWEALTEPEGLRAWLAEDAEIELEPGGELRLRLRDGEERSGFVEEADPPRRLAYWWRAESGDEEALTRVELTLTEVDGGTQLRVTETREVVTVEAVLLPATPLERSSGPEMHARTPLALVS